MHYVVTSGQWAATIPARRSATGIGHWREGECHVPDSEALAAAVPHRWRKALARSGGAFWFRLRTDSPAMLYLYGVRGKRIAIIYALPVKA